jgi:hypothetical protein
MSLGGRSPVTSTPVEPDRVEGHFKDAILAELARHANVAQFVSFAPGTPVVRFVCLSAPLAATPDSLEELLALLLELSGEGAINIRAFEPDQPKSHEFLYGLTSAAEAAAHVRRLSAAGLFTIANETVDVSDGGVSGVAYGGILEFAPDDTPRCVEKPGTMSLPKELGLALLKTVYGFLPDLRQPPNVRTEFSIHPLRRGLRKTHSLLWEEEVGERVELEASFVWPNHFSRLLGDKVFGLLLADALGLTVPAATVINRRIAPFEFGQSTFTEEVWTRTAPFEPIPGKFTTRHGWLDPYELLTSEDPEGTQIASVIAHESVDAAFSGAATIRASTGTSLVEGVRGRGDRFMLGDMPPEPLPARISSDVRAALKRASSSLGDARVEWAHDGESVWILQLHRGSVESLGRVIYPGESSVEHSFRVEQGLEALRELAASVEGTGEGIVLVGQVGVTSHFGDVLRRAQIPSRIETHGSEEAVVASV